MTKWEYLIIGVFANARAAEALNDFGGDGWELVSLNRVLTSLGSYEAVFKRPLELAATSPSEGREQ